MSMTTKSIGNQNSHPFVIPCVWMKHFNNAEKLKCIVFELLVIKFSSFSK